MDEQVGARTLAGDVGSAAYPLAPGRHIPDTFNLLRHSTDYAESWTMPLELGRQLTLCCVQLSQQWRHGTIS